MDNDSNIPGDITVILHRAGSGDEAARKELFGIIYDEVRHNARSQRFVGRYGDTLQPTALANEAYLKFERKYPAVLQSTPDSRRLFFHTLGLVMRAILRDHSKKGGAQGKRMVALGDSNPMDPNEDSAQEIDGSILNDAIDKLRAFNERWAEVVHYRFYAGQTVRDTAGLLGVAESTVKKDWSLAQAWLANELGGFIIE